jgi:hypothetical protein
MMSELVLLSLDRAEFLQLHRAAERGDPDALEAVRAMWSAHAGWGWVDQLLEAIGDKPPAPPMGTVVQ